MVREMMFQRVPIASGSTGWKFVLVNVRSASTPPVKKLNWIGTDVRSPTGFWDASANLVAAWPVCPTPSDGVPAISATIVAVSAGPRSTAARIETFL